MNIHLCEIDYLDPLTFATSTLRFSSGDGGYVTAPGDSPANTFYEPRLKVPNNYEVAVFRDGIKGGCAQGGFGTAQLMNHDKFFDQFVGKCFDGQKFRLLYGDASGPYSGFSVILTGTMCAPEFTWGYFNLKVRDYTELFARAASQYVYLGNNVAGVGVEGTPDDLMGKTKPLCFGKCLNVTPAYVSASNELYQVHNGPIQAVDAVYSDGVALALDTSQGTAGDCATLAALVAASPAAGMYCTCLALGMIRVTGNASSRLTCDVRGANDGPDGYVDTIPGIVKLLAANYCRRKRTNLFTYSQAISGWGKGAGMGVGSVSSWVPVPGMVSYNMTCTAGSYIYRGATVETSMLVYGQFVKPGTTTQFRLRLQDNGATTNNVQAVFDLATGLVTSVTSNGAAVGPQYTATGFITDAGIIAYPDGGYYIWIAGQPNQTFTTAAGYLYALNGTDFIAGGGQLEKYCVPSMYVQTAATAASAYDPPQAPAINAASFSALASLTASVGYYVAPGGTDSVGAIIEALCDSAACWTAQNRAGELVIGQLSKPSAGATPAATFTESEILQDAIESVAPYSSSDGTPAFRVVMQAVKNWTKQSSTEVATSLWDTDPMRVAWVGKEFREIRAESAVILATHPLACEISKTSYLNSQADAVTEARRLLAFYSGDLRRYSFSIKLSLAATIDVGDIVAMKISRFGLGSGRNFIVVGITEDHERGQVKLEVFG